MIIATKNGHDHEFPEQVWERMGTGNTRQGWTKKSEAAEPAEVTVLKKKLEVPVVDPVVAEISKRKTAESELKKTAESEVEKTAEAVGKKKSSGKK